MSDPTLQSADEPALNQAWWLVMLTGLLGIAAGVFVLAKPGNSLAALAVVAGIFILVDGIFELAASLSGYVALIGVLSAVVGIFLVRHPVAGVVAAALFIGFWLVTIGIIHLVVAFEFPEHRLWNIVVAIVQVIAGIVIVSTPGIGLATLALLVGIGFIVNGCAGVALGWITREVRHDEISAHVPTPAV